MHDSQENPFPYSINDAAPIYSAGGDDPDFAPNTAMTPFICTVPILRRMLPQCRPITE